MKSSTTPQSQFASRFSLEDWQFLCTKENFVQAVNNQQFEAAEVLAVEFLTQQTHQTNMRPSTKTHLEQAGWTVECESPLEIRHTDGSFATGQAARIVSDALTPEEFKPVAWKPADPKIQQSHREFKVEEVQLKGEPKYAVRTLGSCLNKEGEMEHEPIPSSREADFIARCRFDSLGEAFEAARAFLASHGL